MKALGLVVSDKKIFESDLFMQPTWTVSEKKSFEWKNNALTHWHTNALTNDGQRTVTKAHSEHFVLRWAKKLIYSTQTTVPCTCKSTLTSLLLSAITSARATAPRNTQNRVRSQLYMIITHYYALNMIIKVIFNKTQIIFTVLLSSVINIPHHGNISCQHVICILILFYF